MQAFELIHITRAFNRLIDAKDILESSRIFEPYKAILDAHRIIEEVTKQLEEVGLQWNKMHQVQEVGIND